ncbi:DoxX family protein [Streptomyces sp. NPDC059467]|uniref:DoxX family protein n=1 Tax=Streptomyces sp. NPDC059467 TaxID=3346844 RepID=UPI0036B4EDF0
MRPLGALLAAGALGLLAGFAVPVPGALATAGLTLYFGGAYRAHMRVQDRQLGLWAVSFCLAAAALAVGLAYDSSRWPRISRRLGWRSLHCRTSMSTRRTSPRRLTRSGADWSGHWTALSHAPGGPRTQGWWDAATAGCPGHVLLPKARRSPAGGWSPRSRDESWLSRDTIVSRPMP